MGRIHAIPVDESPKTVRGKKSGLNQFAASLLGLGLPREPSPAGNLHFCSQNEAAPDFNSLYSPEVESLAGQEFRGVPSTASQARTAYQLVEEASNLPGPVPNQPASLSTNGGKRREDKLGVHRNEGAADLSHQAFSVL